MPPLRVGYGAHIPPFRRRALTPSGRAQFANILPVRFFSLQTMTRGRHLFWWNIRVCLFHLVYPYYIYAL